MATSIVTQVNRTTTGTSELPAVSLRLLKSDWQKVVNAPGTEIVVGKDRVSLTIGEGQRYLDVSKGLRIELMCVGEGAIEGFDVLVVGFDGNMLPEILDFDGQSNVSLAISLGGKTFSAAKLFNVGANSSAIACLQYPTDGVELYWRLA